MKKYIKQRILSMKSGLTYEQKKHVISSIYDRLEERQYKPNETGAIIAETIMEKIKELNFIMSINVEEYETRRPEK